LIHHMDLAKRPATGDRGALTGLHVAISAGLTSSLMGYVVPLAEQVDDLVVLVCLDRLDEGNQIRL
jgi:hypothetical protein